MASEDGEFTQLYVVAVVQFDVDLDQSTSWISQLLDITIMKEINTETVSAFILTKIQLFHQSRCLELFNLPVDVTEKVWKGGGSKVWDPGQGGACNSALMDQMQGAFVGYYWVLVKSRSCDLYELLVAFYISILSFLPF